MDLVGILFYAGLFVAFACILLTALQKPSREQQTALLASIFIGVYFLGHWFLHRSEGQVNAAFAENLIAIGGSQLFFLMLLFALQYCGKRPSAWGTGAVLTVNVIVLVGIVASDWPEKLLAVAASAEPGVRYVQDTGLIYKLYYALRFLYQGLTFLVPVVLILAKKLSGSRRRTLGLLFLSIVPAAGYAADRLLPLILSVEPFAVLLADAVMLLLLLRLKYADILDEALTDAVDALPDALIVMDEHWRFRGCNKAAVTLFPVLASAVAGRRMGKLAPELLAEAKADAHPDAPMRDRVYQPEVRTFTEGKRVRGYALWYFDVTGDRDYHALSARYDRELAETVEDRIQNIRDMQEHIVVNFAGAIESRDLISDGHVKRTSALTNLLTLAMVDQGVYADELTPETVAHIRLAAPLHDIGKVSVPDAILNKPGRLTDEEAEIMRQHTLRGAQLIDENLAELRDAAFYRLARDLALYHHEKWSGRGYPAGLSGTEIPLAARIMAVVDTFDALVSARPYKQPFSVNMAFEIMQSESGEAFDPDILAVFLSLRPRIERAMTEIVTPEQPRILKASRRPAELPESLKRLYAGK